MPPYPQLWNQAQQIAQSQLGAFVQQATRSNRKETRAGQKYIRRLAHSFADELGMISGGLGRQMNMYGNIEGATDAAIADYLGGSGYSQGQSLAGQLGYSPEAAQAAQSHAQRVGNALSKTAVGFGQQNEKQFLGSAANNLAYAKSLPGIAALSGIQSAAGYQQQQSDALRAERDQILQQGPQLASSLYSSFASQASAAADRAQQARFHAQEMNLQRRQLNDAAGSAGADKVQQARDDAFALVQGASSPPPGALPGQFHPPGYPDLRGRVQALFRSRFPGRSDTWVDQETEAMLNQFGLSAQSYAENAWNALAQQLSGFAK